MDLQTMIPQVRIRAGVPAEDGLWTDAAITALVNEALHYLDSESDWLWGERVATVTTSNGDNEYDLPANWKRTLHVTGPDGYLLDEVKAQQILRYKSASGIPRMYDVYQTSIRFAPTPTSALAYIHSYLLAEVDLAAVDDEPLVPAIFHNAIIEYATYLGFRRTGEGSDAAAALAGYQTWVERMKARGFAYAADQGGGEQPVAAMGPT